MIEEDIFGEDSLKLVLRYGNHTILNFDNLVLCLLRR